MGWEVLGTGISIAELLVALIGLGAGGYAGGRAAAVARMRTEDRRAMVELQIPALKRVPQSSVMLVDAEKRWEEGFEAWQNAKAAAVELARLLPWSDRASWARVARELPGPAMPGAISSEYAPPPLTPEVQSDWRHYIGLHVEYFDGYQLDVETLRAGGIGGQSEPPPILDFAERLQDFDDHLRRQLRPSIIGRWRSVVYIADLVRRGPHRV